MENEFHEMDDLNVEPEEDPEDEEETSFINERTGDLFTRVSDLGRLTGKRFESVGKVFSVVGVPNESKRNKQSESAVSLRNNVRKLRELIQKTKMENINKEADKRAEIIRLQKEVDKLNKQSGRLFGIAGRPKGNKQENIELKEIADDERAELVQKQNMESISREAKRRAEIIRLQRKMDRSTKQSGKLFSVVGKPKGSKQSESADRPLEKDIKNIREEAKRRKILRLQKEVDKLTKKEIVDKKADDEQEEMLMRDLAYEITEEEEERVYGPTVVTVSERRTQAIKKKLIYRDCDDFFSNILDLEPQCSQPEFIDHLIDRGILGISRTFSSGLVSEYEVRYLGGDFKTVDWTVDNGELIRDGIRLYYDEWTKAERNKILKKAGIATAIGLSVVALISGLSVGLTRKGADMVHQAKKWEKVTPAKKIRKKVIPWTELEKATGRVVIFTGEHILIVMVGISILLYSK